MVTSGVRQPGDPWAALGTGLVAAGIGMAILAGAPAAYASPSESPGGDTASSEKSAPRAAQRDDAGATRSVERRRSARAADRQAEDERTSRSSTRLPRADAIEATEATEATETEVDDAEPDPTSTRVDDAEAARVTPPAETTVPAATSAENPVTVADIVTDTLTWVGLRGVADDLPLPAAPVSSLLESLWLAVRQTQYTWNNQRPRADAVTSGPGPDGDIVGNLNAVDYDDVALTYAVRTGPAHGTVALDAAGGFVYTPDGSGRADTFTVTIDDTVGNPFHVHGLLGLLGLGGPARVVVTIAGTAAPADLSDVGIVADGQGRIRAVDGRFTDRRVATAADAAEVLNAMASTLGVPENFARPSGITVDKVGIGSSAEITYRFTESVGGVEVVGSDVILVTDIHGAVTGLFNNFRGVGQSFDVEPDATLDEIDEVRRFAQHLFPDTSLHTAQLIVYAPDGRDPRLAWRVIVERPDTGEAVPSGETLVFHADGPYVGEVIVTSASASAYTVTGYARDWLGDYRAITTETREVLSWLRIRELYDAARNIATYRTSYPLFGRLGPVLPGRVIKRGWFGWDRAAVSAHANAAAVYDFFSSVLGRNSFDDRGALIEVSIRYSPVRSAAYANAFWDPIRQQFVFGNGGYLQAALDIVGHEFTHAVVTSVVGGGLPVLDSAESGALNEAYADILGMLIEGKQGRDRWLIGEDSDLGAIRDLADPGSITTVLGPYRAHYEDLYDLPDDDYGEHINSTIFSHAAYRMMTDPATAGVTDDMWATVFYQSLSKLGSAAKFVDGRAAVVNTARTLKWTTAQIDAIEKAFDGVGILAGRTSLTIAA